MEIPAWLFFSFWAIISLTFLKLGFNALDRTDLSTSVPSAVLFLLKHAFAISVCHSSHYALLFRPNLKIGLVRHLFWVGNALNPLVLFGSSVKNKWYYIYCGLINLAAIKERKLTTVPVDHIGLQIDFILKLSMYFIDNENKLLATLVMVISIYTSAVWAAIYDDEELFEAARRLENPLRGNGKTVDDTVAVLCFIFLEKEDSTVFKKMIYRRRKLIQFGVGMVGTIFFQNFFRLTSFDHVVAFLYLAVAWLGNLALLRPSGGDFGVFNFLLGNVIVGCTVSQFGLRGTTWIAFGTSVLLYGLRLKLETVSLVDRREDESQVVVFRQVDDTLIC